MARDLVTRGEDVIVIAMFSIEAVALGTGHPDWAWSTWVRQRCHIDCDGSHGRALFALGWPSFAAWFFMHVLRVRVRRHAATDWPV